MSIGTDKETGLDLDEKLAGTDCPLCSYPIVLECGLEVCYNCGWSNEENLVEAQD